MRKIERQMLDALHSGRDWHCDNTAVVFSDHNGNPYLSAHVELHGNLIAEVYTNANIEAQAELDRYCQAENDCKTSHGAIVSEADSRELLVAAETSIFEEYPTRTTVSRLRALGIPCKTGNTPWVDDAIHKLRESE